MTATSITNSSVSNTTTLRLDNDVTAAAVDLQNVVNGTPSAIAVAGSPDADLDNGGSAWNTVNVNPGDPAEFVLRVVNNGTAPDTFNLAASSSNFAAGVLPTGWQVEFRTQADGLGSVITSVTVLGGAQTDIYARVTPPADAAPATTNIFFRAISATNAAVSDVKMDAEAVAGITDVAITTDQAGEAAPGGIVTLSHTLTNVGTTAVSSGTISFAPGFPTFTETLYWDANNDGVLDSTDPQIDDISDITAGLFDPGESVLLFSRIQVPSGSGVQPGISETATIVVTVAGDTNTANNSVTETVTVVSGNVTVTKLQALDALCDGTADGAFTQAQQSANPGQCIIYQITARNMGTADVSNLRIDDQTPAYTSYEGTGASAATATGGTAVAVTPPADEGTGAIFSTHGTIAAGGQAVLTFSVQIDQ